MSKTRIQRNPKPLLGRKYYYTPSLDSDREPIGMQITIGIMAGLFLAAILFG